VRSRDHRKNHFSPMPARAQAIIHEILMHLLSRHNLFFVFVICTVMLAFYFDVYSLLAWAADSPLLADKHKKIGVDCQSCHQENPPGKTTPMQVCLECHGGDYAKLAEQTKKVAPNPHDSHLGSAKCEFCHHGHKPSEYYCAQCHILDSKVP
jgi:hypothetical protein